jgi:hypothetical protein
MSRTRLVALALAASVLATSGCGSSGNSSKPLTRSELIAKANAICRRVYIRRVALKITKQQDYARIEPQLAAYELAALAEMRKLTPPASMTSDWQQIIAGAQIIADLTKKFGEYAKAHELGRTRTLYSMAAKVPPSLATAKRDGFSDCAQLA